MELREAKPEAVLSIRLSVDLGEANSIQQAVLGELFAHLTSIGVEPAGCPFVRYHGSDAKGLDLEIGVVVGKAVTGGGRIEAREIPGGKVAATDYVGHYATLQQAREELGLWMKDQGLAAAGPLMELYWTDPCEVTDPLQWKTELRWPVRD